MMLHTLYLKLALQILCESCWFMGIRMVQSVRAWEISQVYKVFRGNLYVLCFKTRLTQELRPKV